MGSRVRGKRRRGGAGEGGAFHYTHCHSEERIDVRISMGIAPLLPFSPSSGSANNLAAAHSSPFGGGRQPPSFAPTHLRRPAVALTPTAALITIMGLRRGSSAVEQRTENPRVVGSIPTLGTAGRSPFLGGSGSVVEHLLAKERVVGSNPIFRSTFPYEFPPRPIVDIPTLNR